MRLAALGVFAILVLSLTSVSSFAQTDPKELLIGKWETKEKMGDQELKVTIEFTKDAVVKIAFGAGEFPGKYRWFDKDYIEITMAGADGKEYSDKTKVSVTKDELVVTGQKESRTTKFTRVK
jgi:uncharacterized protein (TIGR03066 family)